MGALKQKFVYQTDLSSNREIEVTEDTKAGDLLRLFGVENRSILTLINGSPADADAGFSEGDRVVLMDPDHSYR